MRGYLDQNQPERKLQKKIKTCYDCGSSSECECAFPSEITDDITFSFNPAAESVLP